ncbi:MAG: hypothetical protein EBR28_05575 [Planctomycetia bacterium]|nr:hypothetical protein [Planctomycetia bacterium]
MQLRGHDRLCVPRGVFGRKEVQAVFRLREDLSHELTEPPVEVGARRAAGFGEDEPALVEVAS